MKKYTFKVYPAGMGREVYRVIEIGGDENLETLCEVILGAYDFFHEHLYEFCMDNRMYGDNSYLFDPESDDSPTLARIDEIGLCKGRNFSLHYDFGDDWMFTIHVQKVEDVSGPVSPAVLKAKGEVEQYPSWDDDEEDEDEEYEEEEYEDGESEDGESEDGEYDDGEYEDGEYDEGEYIVDDFGVGGYAEYKKKVDRIVKQNNGYLDMFVEDMEKAGLSDKTINRHIGNVDFYINEYLQREEPLTMDYGVTRLDSFLGDFFIRKCMWSTPGSIKTTAASIKKFYKCMVDHGLVQEKEYKYLCEEIKLGMPQWQADCAQFNDPSEENPFAIW